MQCKSLDSYMRILLFHLMGEGNEALQAWVCLGLDHILNE